MEDELFEKTMEVICDLCKWPYLEEAGYLKDHCTHCDNCPAEAVIKKILKDGEPNVSMTFAMSSDEALEGTRK